MARDLTAPVLGCTDESGEEEDVHMLNKQLCRLPPKAAAETETNSYHAELQENRGSDVLISMTHGRKMSCQARATTRPLDAS